MDMEQALETQRFKLLRLLAGLAVVVGFLFVAPIAPAWSRWIRGYVFSLLRRAEPAAQSLVLVQACVLAKGCGEAVDVSRLARRSFPGEADDEALPSLAALSRRMDALRRVLEDLPRHGRRLLQRAMKRVAELVDELSIWCGHSLVGNDGFGFAGGQWVAPGLWHPPEVIQV